MSLPTLFDAKERVRQAVDIVDLAGGYLQLRREGRGFKALCPWHDDSRPSLQINPERQSFKCWVCDIGGDIFSFVMKMENVEFPEALALLADRAGVDISSHNTDGNANRGDDKRLLFQAMAWAEAKYHDCLLNAREAEPARRYLDQRGLTEESIERYHLGFAPDKWDWLLSAAVGTPFTPQILEKVGLVARRQEKSGVYDRFRGRVLFSIRDAQSRPVGLGGRVLPGAAAQGNPAKYINSPETPLFSKSNLVFGLDLARDSIGKTRNVIVTEGYTDCIVVRQFGIENVVAVLGTALGERHIQLLKRYADTITLVLDGDEAGQKRTAEILELFVAAQVDLRIMTLPDELDPCDFLLDHGAAEFLDRMSDAVDALEHKLRLVTSRISPARGTHEMNRALEEMLATLARAPKVAAAANSSAAKLREQQMLARLAREFAVSEAHLQSRIEALRTEKPKPMRGKADDVLPAEPLPPLSSWERELLQLVLLDPGAAAQLIAAITDDSGLSHVCQSIVVLARRLLADGIAINFSRLLLEFDDPRVKTLLVELDEEGQAKARGDFNVRVSDLLNGLRRREEDRIRRTRTAELKDRRLDANEELALLQQLIDNERSRQGISLPTDG